MAQEETPAEVEVPKKKGKLLIIILIVVGVIVLVGGGIAAWLLTTAPDKSKQAHGEEGAAEEHDDEHPPIYEKLEQFTVNLADQESYLQTEIQLVVADVKVQEKIKARMPEVRDAMIRLLSSKTAEELSQPDGKDKLAGDIRHELNSVLGIKKDSEGVKKVLFGALIIQ
jgi:flagellar FliL protein